MRTQKEIEYYHDLLKEASTRAEIPEYFAGHMDILLRVLDNDEYKKSSIFDKMKDVIGDLES